jgi:hypothetical protein
MTGVTDPILIAAFLSLGVCFTRALIVAAWSKPPACGRCGEQLEQGADKAVCSCAR